MITLATLHQATAQEVFDQVANHLLTQNKKSQITIDDIGNICAYRGEDNLKCAAGCLIADTEYNTDLENNSWNRLVSNNKVPNYHRSLITYLQRVHDNVDIPDWKEELATVAERFNLDKNGINI